MKSGSLLLALSILTLGAGCRKSEIDTKPAAEVTESSATATAATATAATSTEQVIKEKSRIDWVAAKVTRDHKGEFKNFNGFIEYVGDLPARIAFDIDLNSVVADEPKLTAHLKTLDFFDVATYPKATFTSTSVTAAPPDRPRWNTDQERVHHQPA